jgi:3-hydroxyacyl-[acyl-carrier protein] dehydratase/trans-2-decenoyl-[acyl-carrier protein] isomerase
VPLFKKSFSYKELIDCAKGQLAGVDFPKLPLPPMLMFDEVTKIEETGGAYNKGTAHATYKITPDKWFFPCHFKDDPVMPGCLGMDALWQLLGFSLGNMGGRGKGRAISVGEVKFTGQILPIAKKVEYFLDFKRIINEKTNIRYSRW